MYASYWVLGICVFVILAVLITALLYNPDGSSGGD